MSVETVTFRGIRFRRYPEAKQASHRDYFTPGTADTQRGVEALHREVWKAAHGPIPDGCHIHHVDHDPSNNDVSNLACLTADEHRELHRQSDLTHERHTSPARLAHLEEIRPLATEWHRSSEGRAWHKQHARVVADNAKVKGGICEQCGNAFLSKTPKRFCSNNCKSAWRRDAGLDDVKRICAWCGEQFTVNRYARTRFCSRSCGAKSRRAHPRQTT